VRSAQSHTKLCWFRTDPGAFCYSFPVEHGKPSHTALAATHRAAHQLLEHGRIFADPLALSILGADPQAIVQDAAAHTSRRIMRLFIAVRTRFAEDALARAVERGVCQLVLLGAGLDTYAYRSAFRDRLRIFEVDHPSTQAWKRQRLEDAAIPIPHWLTFAPIDFETQTLSDGLTTAGFDSSQQTFFTWLGVVPYLTEEAIFSTLRFIASLPKGAHVVFDYSDPPDTLLPATRALHDKRAAQVEALGEAWLTYFDPQTLHAKLSYLKFVEIEDLGPREIRSRYFPSRKSASPDRGGHILRGTTIKGMG
jgi:methyltransferase (TIGR00027 family)